MVAKPASVPNVPPGFQVELLASNLRDPRTVRVTPNGDIFIAESDPGRIRVLRAAEGATNPSTYEVFASGLDQPFGIAVLPARIGSTLDIRRQHGICGPLSVSQRRPHTPSFRSVPRSRHRGYSITSSARTSKLAGTANPIAFAAPRLITVSNLVGACTGRSVGLAPRKIWST